MFDQRLKEGASPVVPRGRAVQGVEMDIQRPCGGYLLGMFKEQQGAGMAGVELARKVEKVRLKGAEETHQPFEGLWLLL
jgi:hypothetical protein